VLSVLESSGSAMPAVGYVAGGFIASAYDPRATYLFAGVGVVAIAVFAALLLGSRWPELASAETSSTRPSGADDAVMVELIPAMPIGLPAEGPIPQVLPGGSK
jgi:hypothetical protein